MKITYDKSADAAYIYLEDRIGEAGISKTYMCDPKEVGMINLDFNTEGKLVGIEVMDASKRLSPEVLLKAEQTSKSPKLFSSWSFSPNTAVRSMIESRRFKYY